MQEGLTMDSRVFFSVIMLVLVAALGCCVFFARRSHKSISKAVAWLDAAFIPPIIGNVIIIGSHVKQLAEIGCYIYFTGMDIVVLALINFTTIYCKTGSTARHKTPLLLYIAPALDVVQIMLNPFFGHAFDLEMIMVDEQPYFKLVPYFGQIIHRIVCYSIFLMVIAIFIAMTVRTSRIFREKYAVILASMIIVGLWQTFYIISGTPVDRSMIGFGAFGILAYYFALHHRPLRLLDRMLSNIASETPDAMFLYDPDGKCIWINERAKKLTGLGMSELELINPKLTAMFGKLEYSDENVKFESVLGEGLRKQYYTIDKRIVIDDRRRMAGTVISIRDNTAEQLKMKQELYAATHDMLTGLFTREYLYKCIREKLWKEPETRFYVVFSDVKNFKMVNDIFGTQFGDLTLRYMADLIRKYMSANCVYGRLAADTFGVLIPKDQFDRDSVESSLTNLIVKDGSTEHRVLVHIGVYEVTDPKLDVAVMFDRAHLALSTIKEQFNKHVAFYDKKLRENVLWNQTISAELNTAIEGMQIRPYLQPIADNSGKIVGAEALSRWIHPERGYMPPSDFIPVFEKNGMIVDVDRHIWRCTCEILSRWKNDMFISVNISPIDFYYTDIPATLKALVTEYGIEPARLRVEITESAMMSEADSRLKVMDELRSIGFIVEMDDFGSGYSSLNMLKTMPVDVLKIDMMFLSKGGSDDRSKTIVRNIIRLSNELGIATLTEGVETEDQYRSLSEMGCGLFQGYYFAKPLPVPEFEKRYLENVQNG